jgi:hypothetical protein
LQTAGDVGGPEAVEVAVCEYTGQANKTGKHKIATTVEIASYPCFITIDDTLLSAADSFKHYVSLKPALGLPYPKGHGPNEESRLDPVFDRITFE